MTCFAPLTVLTGAGISTATGIPDFRGPQGVWTKNPRAARLVDYQIYLSDPQVRQQSWLARKNSPMWRAEPTGAHRALAEAVEVGLVRAVLTQNIDGLHAQAGTAPDALVELHGSFFTVVCTGCPAQWPTAQVLGWLADSPDPPCPQCGSILKTSTVMFGQGLDPRAWRRAEAAAEQCSVFLAIGTTLSVQPAASLVPLALAGGAELVIVNASPTEYDQAASQIVREPIEDVLPALLADFGQRFADLIGEQ